jgi:hypothetical protein
MLLRSLGLSTVLILQASLVGACAREWPAEGSEGELRRPTPSSDESDTTDRRFRVGQRWKYRTRPGEEDSILTILRIEAVDSRPTPRRIVHIRVDGVALRTSVADPSHVQRSLPHLPFDRDTLDREVVELVGTSAQVPDFAEGYAQWRDARGGAFTIPIAEVLTVLENAARTAPEAPR